MRFSSVEKRKGVGCARSGGRFLWVGSYFVWWCAEGHRRTKEDGEAKRDDVG